MYVAFVARYDCKISVKVANTKHFIHDISSIKFLVIFFSLFLIIWASKPDCNACCSLYLGNYSSHTYSVTIRIILLFLVKWSKYLNHKSEVIVIHSKMFGTYTWTPKQACDHSLAISKHKNKGTYLFVSKTLMLKGILSRIIGREFKTLY